ncbi:MAG: hypothetical protein EOS85_06520 [Mesorhizobium sp.]|nr:MAG: hypothetical protein EOS85_06520 [Mesorhizobium sp.]
MKPAAIPIKSRPVFGTEDYLLGQQLWHQSPRDGRGEFDAGKEKADRLTMRQLRQMLRLAGSGMSSREIAVVLGIARAHTTKAAY